MHDKQKRYELEMRKARKRVAREDARRERGGFPAHGAEPEMALLQAAMRRIEAAVVLGDWAEAAEGQVLLERLHKRLPDPEGGKPGSAFKSGRAVVFVTEYVTRPTRGTARRRAAGGRGDRK